MTRIIVACLLALVLPASASATTRYASPNGLGASPCTDAANRCTVFTAVTAAVDGDVVELAAPGPYTIGSDLPISKAVTVQGAAVGVGRPVINLNGSVFLSNGARLSDVELVMTGKLDVAGSGSRADRVIARSTGVSGCSVQNAGTLTNAICTASANNANALSTPTLNATIRNVTSYAASGTGLFLTTAATVTNSALEGGGGTDVGVNGTASTLTNDLFTTPDNASPATDTGRAKGHGSYVDKVNFVPTSTPASLTTDKGTNTGVASGELDLDGNLRTINGTTDIGAIELPPVPAVVAGANTKSTAEGATLAGTINTGGGRAQWFFEYGTGFAQTTASTTIAATTSSTAVTADIPVGETGTPYRLVAVSDGGTKRSDDLVAYRTPTLTQADATNVTQTTATLNGSVALKGAPSGKVEFVHGAATSAPQTITADGPVSQALTGLTPNTTYQWKLRVTRGSEIFETPLGTFKTAAQGTTGPEGTPSPEPSASPSPSPSPTATPPTKPTVAVGSSTTAAQKAGQGLLLKGKSLAVRTRCGRQACSVKVTGYVTIGRKRYGTLASPKALKLGPGESGQVNLTANRRLRRRVSRYLKRHPKAKAVIHLKAVITAADGTKVTKRLTIKVRKLKR